MRNTHDYTPEEILDALEMLKNEYNSAPLYALMHGVPQLVKRLREAEADAGVNLQALTQANRAYAELLGGMANTAAGAVIQGCVVEYSAVSQPDGHADALDHLKEYGGGSD